MLAFISLFLLTLFGGIHATDVIFPWQTYLTAMGTALKRFTMLKHNDEISGETGAFKNSKSNELFSAYWVGPSRTGSKTAYIFGGVGSTTTQLFTIYNAAPTAKPKVADTVAEIKDVGKDFGAKTDMNKGELETQAQNLLKSLVDARKAYFESKLTAADGKVEDCSVVLDKTISYGLGAIKNDSPWPSNYAYCRDFGDEVKDWDFLDSKGEKYKLFPLLGKPIKDEHLDETDTRNIGPARAIQALRKVANNLHFSMDKDGKKLSYADVVKYSREFSNFYIKPPCGPNLQMGFGDDKALKLALDMTTPSKPVFKLPSTVDYEGIGDIGGGDTRAVLSPQLDGFKIAPKEEKAGGSLTANELYKLAKLAQTKEIVPGTSPDSTNDKKRIWSPSSDTTKVKVAAEFCDTSSTDKKKKRYAQYIIDLAKITTDNKGTRKDDCAKRLAKTFAEDIGTAAGAVGISKKENKWPVDVYQTGVMRADYYKDYKHLLTTAHMVDYDDNMLDDTDFIVVFDKNDQRKNHHRHHNNNHIHRLHRRSRFRGY